MKIPVSILHGAIFTLAMLCSLICCWFIFAGFVTTIAWYSSHGYFPPASVTQEYWQIGFASFFAGTALFVAWWTCITQNRKRNYGQNL